MGTSMHSQRKEPLLGICLAGRGPAWTRCCGWGRGWLGGCGCGRGVLPRPSSPTPPRRSRPALPAAPSTPPSSPAPPRPPTSRSWRSPSTVSSFLWGACTRLRSARGTTSMRSRRSTSPLGALPPRCRRAHCGTSSTLPQRGSCPSAQRLGHGQSRVHVIARCACLCVCLLYRKLDEIHVKFVPNSYEFRTNFTRICANFVQILRFIVTLLHARSPFLKWCVTHFALFHAWSPEVTHHPRRRFTPHHRVRRGQRAGPRLRGWSGPKRGPK